MRSVISPSVVVMDDRYIMEIGGAVHDEDVSVKTLQFEEFQAKVRKNSCGFYNFKLQKFCLILISP